MVPGRPEEYTPRFPAEILDRAAENRCQEFERFRRDLEAVHEVLLAEFQPRYEHARREVTSTEESYL